jgi:hypothetical protein
MGVMGYVRDSTMPNARTGEPGRSIFKKPSIDAEPGEKNVISARLQKNEY